MNMRHNLISHQYRQLFPAVSSNEAKDSPVETANQLIAQTGQWTALHIFNCVWYYLKRLHSWRLYSCVTSIRVPVYLFIQ